MAEAKLFEREEGLSLRDRRARLVATLKHSRLARAAVAPVMATQFARRDRSFVRTEDSRRLRAMEGSHAGERCFIVGNGPSLTIADLDALKDEVTFAANRIYRMFEETSWRPTYYLAVDREMIAQEANNLAGWATEQSLINLTPASLRLSGTPGLTLINKRPKFYSTRKYTTDNVFFSREPWRNVSEGYTVTYTALQLALYMGFAEIYLIGMDHTFRVWADSQGRLHTNEGVKDHAFVDPKGAVINPQYKEGVEYAYWIARYEAEARGARIYNATRGGSLEVFERVDLNEVLAKVEGEK